MKRFNFKKIVGRNAFTTVFGGIGKHRTVLYFASGPTSKSPYKRTKLAMIRRAHQGWRNRVYGSMMALKIRRQYGRRKPVPQFRR